jgi:hypothetical protein
VGPEFVGVWDGYASSCPGGDSEVGPPVTLAICPDGDVLLQGYGKAGGASLSFTFCGSYTAAPAAYAAGSTQCPEGNAELTGCFPMVTSCTWDVWDSANVFLYFSLISPTKLAWDNAGCQGGGGGTILFKPTDAGATDSLCNSTGCTAPASLTSCASGSGSSGGVKGGQQCGTDCDCGECWYCQSGTCYYAGVGAEGVCIGGCE